MDNINKLKEQFEKTKEEILSISYLKKGSISKCYQTCGTASCRCHRDKSYRHGPYYWWTSKENAKSKSILVPEGMLDEIRACINNYKLLKNKIKLLEDISEKIIRIRIKDYREELKKDR
jgi:hypothetical protein